jgi:hypothetical protein
MGKYILNTNGEPVLATDLLVWATWMEMAERHVAQDWIEDMHVSTVFLGIDHDFTFQGPPVLWETMIFGGPLDGYMERYTSREAAIQGHANAITLLKMELEMMR